LCHIVVAVRNTCLWLFVQSVQSEYMKRGHFVCPLLACFISEANRFVWRILFWFISLKYQMLLLFYYTWSSNDTSLIFWETTDCVEYWNYFESGEYLMMDCIKKCKFWVGGAVVGSISVHYWTDSRWCSGWQYICTLLNWQ